MFLDFLTSILCDVRFICSSCRVAIPDVSMSIKPTIVKHTPKKKKNYQPLPVEIVCSIDKLRGLV